MKITYNGLEVKDCYIRTQWGFELECSKYAAQLECEEVIVQLVGNTLYIDFKTKAFDVFKWHVVDWLHIEYMDVKQDAKESST